MVARIEAGLQGASPTAHPAGHLDTLVWSLHAAHTVSVEHSAGRLVAARPETWEPPARFDEYTLVKPLGRGRSGLVYVALDTLLE